MSWKLGYMFQTVFAQIDQVTDHLFISSAHGLIPKRLHNKGITCVINVSLEVSDVRAPGIEVMRVRVADVPHSNLSLYFDKCADKIHSVQQAGGRTLVHCVAGVSRSASICMAYLIKYQKMPLLEAYKLMKASRPVVHPNNGFFRQLINYERKLLGTTSVKMVNTVHGLMPDVYRQEMEEWYEHSRRQYLEKRERIRQQQEQLRPARQRVKQTKVSSPENNQQESKQQEQETRRRPQATKLPPINNSS